MSVSVYLVVHCFHLLSFLLVILLFKMAPKCSVEVVAIVAKCKKAVMCLMEEIVVLHKLPLGLSYCDFDHVLMLMNHQCTGWGKSGFTVVHVKNATRINK